MTLIPLLLLIVVLGIAVYLIRTYVPMDEKYKSLLSTIGIIVVIFLFIVWMLGVIGYPINLRGVK